jgi:hypothetical protein
MLPLVHQRVSSLFNSEFNSESATPYWQNATHNASKVRFQKRIANRHSGQLLMVLVASPQGREEDPVLD